MIRKFLALSVVLLATAAFASAQDFSFTYNGGSGDTASGTLVTTAQSTPGEYLITGITNGLFDGSAITLLSPGTFPPTAAANDNLLFDPANPGYLDYDGVSFSTASESLNLFYGGSGYGYEVTAYTNNYLDASGTLAVTPLTTSPTPEPSSLLLLGTGLLGVFAVLRRKYAA